MDVLPAGRVTSARQRSYTVAVREMAGAVGWVSGVPCRMSSELFRLAASNRRTMRSMRGSWPSAKARVRVSASRMMMLYPSNRAGRTQPCPALTVTLTPPAGVTAKSSSAL